MGRLFGTDGVRGIANRDLSVELSVQIGTAVAMVLRENCTHKPTVFIGKDTRASSDMIEAALIAGLCSGGADVVRLGVVPTPMVAYIVNTHEADAGVMISASHNPFEFNGIKVFGAGGLKLSDDKEKEVEDIVLDHAIPFIYATPEELGTTSSMEGAIEEYISHLVSTISVDVTGLRVLVDCSNGSACATAPALFARLGCHADIINANPDGKNVNNACGSTHVELLSEQVVKGGYDLAVAFDGDADRCLAVDEAGNIINGDQMIAIFATDMKKNGKLRGNAAVVTVMSNFGFFRFAEEQGIGTRTTKVGDRYVLEAMLEEGYAIGGEQSGHIIFSDYMTTGDGQLSALQLIAAVKSTKKSLGELSHIITIMPQVLLNVEATRDMKAGITESVELNHVLRHCEARLGGKGRVLLRPSGTEPLIRVMAEGENMDELNEIANELATAIKKYL
ncbi:MAG: phosphoglucosamine mutase [Angelakisella sp.]